MIRIYIMKGTVQMEINILPLLRGENKTVSFSGSVDMAEQSEDISEGKATVSGTVKNFSGYMLLEAKVDMHFSALCGRCGKSTPHVMAAQLSRPVAQKLTEEDDDYLIADENGMLEVGEAVMEAIYMELPVRFLCSESCKGLCPICGCDLNDTSCSCVEKKVDPRLAKLREYLESIEENEE